LLGSRGAAAQIDAAELSARLGRGEDAERALQETARSLEQRPDHQALLDLRVVQARVAYEEGRLTDAATRCRQALKRRPDDASASLVRALVRIRSGQPAEGAAAAKAAIAQFEQTKSFFEAAEGRLAAAQALAVTGGPAWHRVALNGALENLRFSEPRKIWESIWRAHAVAAQTGEAAEAPSHRVAAAAGLAQLKMQWPSTAFDGYLGRPEIQRMARSVM
jgi:tetratricopeptide (TPR) repeat protein